MESYEKLQHLSIPSKTATLVPEFAVEELSSAEHSGDDDIYNSQLGSCSGYCQVENE